MPNVLQVVLQWASIAMQKFPSFVDVVPIYKRGTLFLNGLRDNWWKWFATESWEGKSPEIVSAYLNSYCITGISRWKISILNRLVPKNPGQAAIRLLRDGGGCVEFSRFVAALVPSCHWELQCRRAGKTCRRVVCVCVWYILLEIFPSSVTHTSNVCSKNFSSLILFLKKSHVT